jgi:uncharacterized membrane protein/ketosteroid isomerase-like protein
MPDLIEPNIHPVFVHFTYALLVTSALSLFVVAISSPGGWRDTLKHAGDWMLAFGIIAAIATIAAGFQAYFSVNHDGPSHTAMITHRNWALPTAGFMVLLAIWRFIKRAEKPGAFFALLLLLAAGSLSVTAWWGGRLVFVHGLGVQSMPAASGEGHDHEHGPDGEHGDAPARSEEPAEEHSHEGDAGHDEPPAAAQNVTASGEYPSSPADVADAFATALKSGDAAMVERLLLPDVLIAEGGGAERSFAEYAGHHLPADMAFTKAVESTLKDRKVIQVSDMATIISSSQMHGSYQGKTIHSQMMETMVLRLVDGQWLVAHIHWSSAPLKEDHEH